MRLASSSPTMEPRMRGSAMGDLFPAVITLRFTSTSGTEKCEPWKSGYKCKSFVNSVSVSAPCSTLSFSKVSWRTTACQKLATATRLGAKTTYLYVCFSVVLFQVPPVSDRRSALSTWSRLTCGLFSYNRIWRKRQRLYLACGGLSSLAHPPTTKDRVLEHL